MEDINNYLTTIIRIAYDQLPAEDGWKDFTVEVFCLTKFVQIHAFYKDADDQQVSFNPKKPSAERDEDLTFLFMDLRKAMYEQAPGKGAWYTGKVVVNNEGKFDTSFDYDNKPAFMYEPSKEKYAHDLATFPREEQLVPVWLKELIKS